MIKRVFLAVLLLSALLLLSGCAGEGDTQNAPDPSAASTINVPQFSAKDVDGQWRHTSEWFGKQPVVINFWGTWCGPCRYEIPDLARLYEEYGPKGIELISIAVKDSPERVRQYAAENNMDWVLLMWQDQILIDYKATMGIPTTVFIDKTGNEVARFIGMKDYNTLKRGFEAIL